MVSGGSLLLFCGTGGRSAEWSLVSELAEGTLRTAFRGRKCFQMVFFTWSEETCLALERILSVAAEVYTFPFSILPLLLSVQELALNGVKANMKKAAISSSATPSAGLALFNEQLGQGAQILAKLARQRGYWTAIVMKTKPGWMQLDVINAAPLLSAEERRINERLRLASKFDSVEHFHQQAAPSLEGAGLGLYLANLGLQALEVERHRLRIRSDRSGYTIARISLAWGTPTHKAELP